MFISIVPSVWHILVRVCCDAEFLPCFPFGFYRQTAVSDGGKFRNCGNCITRMTSIVFDAHTLCIGCKDQVCNMSVHCYEVRLILIGVSQV